MGAMMRHQLAEFRARGEFLSVLPASEAPIYGRFGYGPATYTARLTVPRHQAAFARPRAGGAAGAPVTGSGTSSVEVLRRAERGKVLEEVFDRRALPALPALVLTARSPSAHPAARRTGTSPCDRVDV